MACKMVVQEVICQKLRVSPPSPGRIGILFRVHNNGHNHLVLLLRRLRDFQTIPPPREASLRQAAAAVLRIKSKRVRVLSSYYTKSCASRAVYGADRKVREIEGTRARVQNPTTRALAARDCRPLYPAGTRSAHTPDTLETY